MTITLTGANSFSLHQRLDELVDGFTKEHGELALERIDAVEAEVDTIKEAIQSMPFLATSKMVVLRAGARNKDFAEQIEQTISSISDDTNVIFYEPEIDKRTAYFKLLKKHTQFEEFPELNKNSLAKWLEIYAKKLNARISYSDANYMVERLGENQQLLSNELAKLVTYDSVISRDNINLLTDPTPQSKVFDLLDAAFAGRKTKALELYDDQRAQQVEPQAILGMIAWQLQLLALIKFSKGKTTTEIAKSAGMNPYPVNKAANMARSMSDEKLHEMVDEALNIDIKSKTTSLDLDEALKTYIATI